MDRNRFTAAAPGEVVRTDLPVPDWSFIPHELPPAWEFDVALWPLLANAKEALGTLNGIGQTLANPQLLLRPLQNREAISSSSMEGTIVTPEELLLFELDPSEPDSPEGKQADWLEVFNYGRALQRGADLLETLPLCNRLILEMHEVLMRGVRGRHKSPGQFRRCAVQLGSTGRFIPPPWTEVDRLMANLEKYLNFPGDEVDPLVRCFIVHYQFEAIHPFRDGNGRVGRALLALMVQHWLGHSMPWLYLSAFFEKYKEEYIQNLFNVSTQGAWSEWIAFCLRATVVQAKDAVRRCHAFNRLRESFQTRVESKSARSFHLIESLFKNPVATVTSVAKQFQVTYHTAKADLERLVASGILVEVAGSRPKSYACREILEVAFGDDLPEA